jgi:hypothetical protein
MEVYAARRAAVKLRSDFVPPLKPLLSSARDLAVSLIQASSHARNPLGVQ